MLTEPKRPQLDATELHQLKWLLGTLLGLLSAWTVPYMEISAWPWLALITVAAALVLWRPALGARLPRWAHRLVFPFILAVAAADGILTRDILPPLVRLTLMLLLYRMVTPRQRRDDMQLALMGLFLVVVAGVLSVSIVFAVQILLFTACALLFLLTVTLAGTAGPAPETARADWPALARRVRAVTNWRVALLGGGLFAGLVAVSATFFLLLPRFELGNSLFFEKLMQGKARTGFSEEVKLGDVTDIQDDDSVAFRVEVSDTAQAPKTPYWRMLVLDQYKAGAFKMSDQLKKQLRAYPGKTNRYMGPGTENLPAGAANWTFYFEPGTSRFLPVPGDFYQIMFGEPQAVLGSRLLRVVSLDQPPTRMLAYRVDQAVLSRQLPEPTGDDLSQLEHGEQSNPNRHYRGLPAEAADAAQLFSLAAELGVPGDDPDDFARRACAWLARRHGYSKQVDLSGKQAADPVVRWMGSELPGHCEYFASSFVLLARAAGFPARLVVGFKGGQWNQLSGNFVVRNTNAHAWAEIFDARDPAKPRWLRVDPTVGADALGESTSALLGEAALREISDNTWGARLDSLRVFWYRRVVSFDKDTRAEVAKVVKESVEKFGVGLKVWARQRLGELRAWAARPWDWQRLAAWAGIVAGAVALVRGARAARLAWLRRRGGDPVRREAGRWLARLAARGATGGDVRPALERLRYGAAATWPDPATVFRAARRASKLTEKP